MCVVSMIGKHYENEWGDIFKRLPQQDNGIPLQNPVTTTEIQWPQLSIITKAEFDELKKEVEQMKKLLEKAVEYDKNNNEPHCEMDDKVAVLKKIAEYVGVSLDDIFKTDKI